jgi:hypothetical protein
MRQLSGYRDLYQWASCREMSVVVVIVVVVVVIIIIIIIIIINLSIMLQSVHGSA